MANLLIIVFVTAAVFLMFYFRRKITAARSMKIIIATLLSLNIFIITAAGVLFFTSAKTIAQEEQVTGEGEKETTGDEYKNFAAALAIGLAVISAGIAVSITGSAAIGGITQNPEIFGRSLVFVGLAEGIAIYGLIVSFMILTG